MKRMIEVNADQIIDLVVDDLKESYRMNCMPDKIDCSDDTIPVDEELLNALDVVLRYYMTPNQIDEWNKSKGAVL